jgi:hypothetical protein
VPVRTSGKSHYGSIALGTAFLSECAMTKPPVWPMVKVSFSLPDGMRGRQPFGLRVPGLHIYAGAPDPAAADHRGEVCLGASKSGTFQRWAAVNRLFGLRLARGHGELPLLNSVRSAILASKLLESGEYRFTCDLPKLTQLSALGGRLTNANTLR